MDEKLIIDGWEIDSGYLNEYLRFVKDWFDASQKSGDKDIAEIAQKDMARLTMHKALMNHIKDCGIPHNLNDPNHLIGILSDFFCNFDFKNFKTLEEGWKEATKTK